METRGVSTPGRSQKWLHEDILEKLDSHSVRMETSRFKVHIISGRTASGESSNFANSIPVASWMDDECHSVRAVMHRAKRQKKKDALAYDEARRHFKALRDAKIGAWRQKWRTFWDPLSSSFDPRAVWQFVRKLFGGQSSDCTCSAEEICEHFEDVGKPHSGRSGFLLRAST